MYKVLYVAAAMCVATSAHGDWIKQSGTADSILYLDPTTVRRVDNKVKVWQLLDYKTAQTVPDKLPLRRKHPFQSAKTQAEYDCKEELWRTIYETLHAEPMGNGEVMHTSNFVNSRPDWAPVAPGTMAANVFAVLCPRN